MRCRLEGTHIRHIRHEVQTGGHTYSASEYTVPTDWGAHIYGNIRYDDTYITVV
jgi:hypothetical protein